MTSRISGLAALIAMSASLVGGTWFRWRARKTVAFLNGGWKSVISDPYQRNMDFGGRNSFIRSLKEFITSVILQPVPVSRA